jgi:hypothetical protein
MDLRMESETDGKASSLICPHCYNDINSPWRKGSQVQSNTIMDPQVDFEMFKDAVNAALNSQFISAPYNEVQVLLLNWKANDLGSQIFDETKELCLSR